MSKYDLKPYRLPSDEEMETFGDVMQEFGQLQTVRNTFASHWEEVAQLVLPTSRNTFMFGAYNTPGEKKTQMQVDATGAMALVRFGAILDSLLTPRNSMWHSLSANNDYVMKDRATRIWFEQVTKLLFKYRYDPLANFSSQNQLHYQSLGAFGTGGMFVDALDFKATRQRGLRYRHMPLGGLYLRENHQGLIDGYINWFRLTARQAYQKWPDNFPEALRVPLESNSETQFDFLHRVCPNTGYDHERIAYGKNKPFSSCYVSIQGRCVLEEGGYYTFPLPASRYDQNPGDGPYGRGPAMMVLPALKTLNAEKKVFLKQGHRAADPVLLGPDNGLLDMSMRPGAFNAGGVNTDGRPLVHALPAGEIQISKEMMAEEKGLINDAFLVTLFQILTETPQMSATEVIERTNEKGILVAPTVGRQQSEYLGSMIPREISVLAEQGLLPPMPPRLREAQGEYQVVYTSPLSRMMRASEAAGFWRTVDQTKDAFQVSQDPSLFDPFDFDTAIAATAEINGTMPSWMASEGAIESKRKGRAKAQAAQQQVQAMPAQAAMMKAQAVAAEKGQPQAGQG